MNIAGTVFGTYCGIASPAWISPSFTPVKVVLPSTSWPPGDAASISPRRLVFSSMLLNSPGITCAF